MDTDLNKSTPCWKSIQEQCQPYPPQAEVYRLRNAFLEMESTLHYVLSVALTTGLRDETLRNRVSAAWGQVDSLMRPRLFDYHKTALRPQRIAHVKKTYDRAEQIKSQQLGKVAWAIIHDDRLPPEKIYSANSRKDGCPNTFEHRNVRSDFYEVSPNNISIAMKYCQKIICHLNHISHCNECRGFVRMAALVVCLFISSGSSGMAEDDSTRRKWDRKWVEESKLVIGWDKTTVVRRVARRYDKSGHLVEEVKLDQDDNLRMEDGYCREVTRYKHHFPAECSYYDQDGRSALFRGLYSRWEADADKNGQEVERRFFGKHGEPATNEHGYFKHQYTYDHNGLQNDSKFFGIDGKPVHRSGGYHQHSLLYNLRGQLLEQAYFSTDGAPVVFQFARETRIYNGHRETERSFYGLDGELMLDPEYHWARQTKVYNSEGKLIEEAFYDENLSLVISHEGYAKMKCAFDGRGNQTDTSFFGADGKPMLFSDSGCWSGVARMVVEYNERDQPTIQYLFGTDGKLLPRGAITTYSYDARGEEKSRSLFDAKGMPQSEESYKTSRRRIYSRFIERDKPHETPSE